jgi:hypothetical protein
MNNITKKYYTSLSTVTTQVVLELTLSSVILEVASEVFLVVFADEFHMDPVNVLVFVGASVVHLAVID